MSEDLFPYRLKLLRSEKNITLEYLANKVGTSKAALSRYEKGERSPKIPIVGSLADFFGVNIAWLAGLSDEREIKSDIITMYNRLLPPRQKKVYECVEKQLEEQQKEQNKRNGITNLQSYKEKKEKAADSYGAVSAGTGEFLFGVENAETVYLPESSFPDEPFDYVLKINGDSMLPTYKDGEYIFVKSFSNGGNIRNGMLAIVMYDNEVYFKKLYFDDSGIRLVSLNKEYKDIVITDPSCFQVLGKVVA